MPKPRRVIRITASLILTMFLMTTVACAPPSVPDEPGAQDVTLADQDVTVTSALQNAADYDKLYATIKRIAAGAKSISDVYSGATGAFNAIVAILRLAGIINPAPDTIGVLTAEIDALGVSLSWQRAASDRDLDMAWMVTALDTIENNTGPPLTNQSTVIANSLTAVNNAEGLAAGSPFLRSFAEASTDGIINWKGVVQNRPTAASNPTVYDWRMGVPILMKLIALRLVVIGAVDPNFRTDHVYDTEMERHRNVLLDQMRTMLDGVRCDQHDYLVTTLPVGGLPAPTIAWGCNLACADVHSGIAGQFLFHPSWSQLDRRCPSTTGTQEFIDKRNTLIAQVIAKMPIAEMRMLIDRLYTFRHPAPDLTAALGRIANEDQNLCIEVAGGSAAAGTPLQLAACNGSNAQNWSYNRQTGQIVNPALGTCIDVATGNPLPNATVHSWPCSGVAGDPPQATNPNQVWSYDPENKQLHSVFGTVLKADFIGAGAPMKTFLNVLPFTVVPSVPFGSPTPSVTVQPQQERWVADEHNRKDFNGDLHTDVLWHNPTTGNLSAWFLDGTTVLGDGALSWAVPESTGLQVKGTGDFNGDGQTDVLWHNPGTGSVGFWAMNGTTVLDDENFNWTVLGSTGWELKGTGDFNRDGHIDLLWHNPGTGSVSVWYLNGTTSVAGSGMLSWTVLGSTGWELRGTGDFNRDGHMDVLWHHLGTGEVAVWFMNGTNVSGSASLNWTVLGSTGWELRGTGDFNRDGRVDLLWHQPGSGSVGVWLMNGTTVSSAPSLSWSAGAPWEIVSR